MRNILVIGAGKSSTALIQYLLKHSASENWTITVADVHLPAAQEKVKDHPAARAVAMQLESESTWLPWLQQSDLVISMLPAFLHPVIAKACLQERKHLITPSYVSDAMFEMQEQVKAAGLCFLNEMGLDPGIDHMTAMEVIHRLKAEGAEVSSFESYCGGLVAVRCDNNPFHYKFSWNPRNVILAGQGDGGIRYRQNHQLKVIPYHQLFRNRVSIPYSGDLVFEGYPNRDSVKYISWYGLETAATFIRGTLRKNGFCSIWQTLIDLGLTDDKTQLHFPEGTTWNTWTSTFIPGASAGTEIKALSQYLPLHTKGEEISALKWCGLFSEEPIPFRSGTPAQYLQALLEQKLALEENDTDAVVMIHRMLYRKADKTYRLTSSFYLEGTDRQHTAMSLTVGLPLAIAAKLILNRKITQTGVCMPLIPEIYEPVLEELKALGIGFTETVEEV